MLEKRESEQYIRVEMDINWLKEAVLHTLIKNRVDILVPTSKNPKNKHSYHAPSLRPIEYPDKLPSLLRWLYKLWWDIKEPLEVRYPHQWTWDSCAHSIVMTHIDLAVARDEIELLLHAQSPNGFIPHMIWNDRRLHWADKWLKRIYPHDIGSPYLQPPALAEATERVAVEYKYKNIDNLNFLQWALPRLKKYYLHIHNVRVPSNDGLPVIISSYESKDRSPEYDTIYGSSNDRLAPIGPMASLTRKYTVLGWDIDKIFASKRFLVKDTLFCCIYVQNLRAMKRLCDMVGDNDGDTFAALANVAEQSILSKMYDEETGLFYSLDARCEQNEKIKMNTISCLIPLILDNIGPKEVDKLVKGWLLNINEYWTKYPIPVEPVSSKYHNMRVIWRGHQTWIYTNWYIEKGLRKHAYSDIADELTIRTYKLVEKEGFREYYSAISGKGERALDFGWSTLILDMVFDMLGNRA